MRKYYYTDGISKYGPFTLEALSAEPLTVATRIWYYGLPVWTPLSDLSELSSLAASLLPPSLPEVLSEPVENPVEKEVARPQAPSPPRVAARSNEPVRPVPYQPKIGQPRNRWVYLWVPFALILFFIGLIKIGKTNIESNRRNRLNSEIVSSAYDIAGVDFSMYVEKFYRDIEDYGIYPKRPRTVIIRFAHFEHITDATHIHGISFGYDDDDRIEIYINNETWSKFTKPMRYFLLYHELSHDILNLRDLPSTPENAGRLMYPSLDSYNTKTMDDFIESSHACFRECSSP